MNAILGQQSRTGRWSTYNTPMDGKRIPNTTAIAFQKRPGSEELNCCSVNAARGFGLISDCALMTDDEGLILNWYGPSTMSAKAEGVSGVRDLGLGVINEVKNSWTYTHHPLLFDVAQGRSSRGERRGSLLLFADLPSRRYGKAGTLKSKTHLALRAVLMNITLC